MDCKVIVMNANGCVIKGVKIGGMEIPIKRKDARQKVIINENPDLILIQESNVKLENICTQNFEDRDYQAIGGKDAGVIFDTTTFMLLPDPSTRIRQIYEFKLETGEISSSGILSRMCAVMLEGLHPNAQPFLCVSWHGPYKQTTLQKINLFYDLCLLIKTYLMENQIPVIFGGDFNLDLIKIPPPLVLIQPVLMIKDYMTLDHRPNKIDFVITSQTIINVSCKPVDIFDIIEELFPNLPLKYYKVVLDHDPLVVNVTLPNLMSWQWVPTTLPNNVLLPNQPIKFG